MCLCVGQRQEIVFPLSDAPCDESLYRVCVVKAFCRLGGDQEAVHEIGRVDISTVFEQMDKKKPRQTGVFTICFERVPPDGAST